MAHKYLELASKLRRLEDIAYGYHINQKVLGIPVEEFEELMCEAANALENAKASPAQQKVFKVYVSNEKLQGVVQKATKTLNTDALHYDVCLLNLWNAANMSNMSNSLIICGNDSDEEVLKEVEQCNKVSPFADVVVVSNRRSFSTLVSLVNMGIYGFYSDEEVKMFLENYVNDTSLD